MRAGMALVNDREVIAKERLMELRSSTSRDWDRVKWELDKALGDLKVVLDSAPFRPTAVGERK